MRSKSSQVHVHPKPRNDGHGSRAGTARGPLDRQATDQALGKSDKIDAPSSDIAVEASKTSDAAKWAMDTAKDTLQPAAVHVRRAGDDGSEDLYQDPISAILIAAGTGALLMGLVAMTARSGARTVKRNVQR